MPLLAGEGANQMQNRLVWPLGVFFHLKLRRSVREIVRDAANTLWPDVVRKKPNSSLTELNEYVQIRAAQLVHPKVDALLRAYPSVSAGVGNRLLAIASRGVESVIARRLTELSTRPRKAA